MNPVGQPFLPPAQPPAAPPPPPPIVPAIDHTRQLATTLTATTASFLEPQDLGHFAQTSKHNYAGAEMAVRARLKQEFRALPQPLRQFAEPARRIETAVPIDITGRQYLMQRGIEGVLSVELIKTGACSIQELERRIDEFEAFVLCPDVEESDVWKSITVLDYILAEKVTCLQVDALLNKLTEAVIDTLDNAMVRECIRKGYLTFEQAVNLEDSDVALLNSETAYINNDDPLNLNELLVRNMITLEFADSQTEAVIDNLIRQAAGVDFSQVRATMDSLRSSISGTPSAMEELD